MIFGELQIAEFVYAIFGSFIGFLFALGMDRRVKKREEREKIDTLMRGVMDELLSIKKEIGDNDNGQILYFTCFVWQSVTASDFFPTLLKERPDQVKTIIKIHCDCNMLLKVQDREDFKYNAALQVWYENTKKEIICRIDKIIQ